MKNKLYQKLFPASLYIYVSKDIYYFYQHEAPSTCSAHCIISPEESFSYCIDGRGGHGRTGVFDGLTLQQWMRLKTKEDKEWQKDNSG